MWKLLTRAFQWCITLYSQKWTVWPWEAIFCKKLPEKQLFWGTRIWIKWLWAAITPVQNLQISKTTTFSESSGRQLSDELSGSPLASILSERRAVTLLRGGGHRNLQKNDFFASFASPRKFCEEKFYPDFVVARPEVVKSNEASHGAHVAGSNGLWNCHEAVSNHLPSAASMP